MSEQIATRFKNSIEVFNKEDFDLCLINSYAKLVFVASDFLDNQLENFIIFSDGSVIIFQDKNDFQTFDSIHEADDPKNKKITDKLKTNIEKLIQKLRLGRDERFSSIELFEKFQEDSICSAIEKYAN